MQLSAGSEWFVSLCTCADLVFHGQTLILVIEDRMFDCYNQLLKALDLNSLTRVKWNESSR